MDDQLLTDDGLTRNPSDPRYKDHLKQRVVGFFGGVKPSRDEFKSVLSKFLESDQAAASGMPVQPTQMPTQADALREVTRDSPIQAALVSGFKGGADTILGTLSLPSMPAQIAMRAATGRDISVPTVEDIIPGDTPQLRAALTAANEQAASMGLKGAALQAPGAFAGALAPMGLAGKGANLLGTGIRRGLTMMATEATQQAGQEGYAPQSVGESMRRLASQGLGGLTSVAGAKAASMLPGAGAGKRILASALAST